MSSSKVQVAVKKLFPKFVGPHRVLKVLSPTVYVLGAQLSSRYV